MDHQVQTAVLVEWGHLVGMERRVNREIQVKKVVLDQEVRSVLKVIKECQVTPVRLDLKGRLEVMEPEETKVQEGNLVQTVCLVHKEAVEWKDRVVSVEIPATRV